MRNHQAANLYHSIYFWGVMCSCSASQHDLRFASLIGGWTAVLWLVLLYSTSSLIPIKNQILLTRLTTIEELCVDEFTIKWNTFSNINSFVILLGNNFDWKNPQKLVVSYYVDILYCLYYCSCKSCKYTITQRVYSVIFFSLSMSVIVYEWY